MALEMTYRISEHHSINAVYVNQQGYRERETANGDTIACR